MNKMKYLIFILRLYDLNNEYLLLIYAKHGDSKITVYSVGNNVDVDALSYLKVNDWLVNGIWIGIWNGDETRNGHF